MEYRHVHECVDESSGSLNIGCEDYLICRYIDLLLRQLNSLFYSQCGEDISRCECLLTVCVRVGIRICECSCQQECVFASISFCVVDCTHPLVYAISVLVVCPVVEFDLGPAHIRCVLSIHLAAVDDKFAALLIVVYLCWRGQDGQLCRFCIAHTSTVVIRYKIVFIHNLLAGFCVVVCSPFVLGQCYIFSFNISNILSEYSSGIYHRLFPCVLVGIYCANGQL